MTKRSKFPSASPYIPVSWGELFDKISILEIKKEYASNKTVIKNVVKEFELLNEILSHSVLEHPEISGLRKELKNINRTLWDIEDEIRIKEGAHDFGSGFIELARNTYIFNDKRAYIKRKINEILNSEIFEEKVY